MKKIKVCGTIEIVVVSLFMLWLAVESWPYLIEWSNRVFGEGDNGLLMFLTIVLLPPFTMHLRLIAKLDGDDVPALYIWTFVVDVLLAVVWLAMLPYCLGLDLSGDQLSNIETLSQAIFLLVNVPGIAMITDRIDFPVHAYQ